MKDKLILIGNASSYFDEEDNPISFGNFKYLMVSEVSSNKLQMLIMVENDPFTLHAEALYSYMKRKRLLSIKINGGGKLSIWPASGEPRIWIGGKSFAFGKANPEEVCNFLNSVWPSFTASTKLMEIDPNRKSMEITGKVFSWATVKYEAERSHSHQ